MRGSNLKINIKVFNLIKMCRKRMSTVSSSIMEERSIIVNDKTFIFEKNTQNAILEFIKNQQVHPFYFHLELTFMDFLKICEDEKNAFSLVKSQGLILPEDVFKVVSGHAYELYGKKLLSSSQGEDIQMYFSVEIQISNDNDVKRLCSIFHDNVGVFDEITIDTVDRMMHSKFPNAPNFDQDIFNYLKSEEGREYLISRQEKFKLKNPKQHQEFNRDFILMLRTCKVCKARSPKLPSCSKCKKVYYCGVECQTKDWKTHRNECMLK